MVCWCEHSKHLRFGSKFGYAKERRGNGQFNLPACTGLQQLQGGVGTTEDELRGVFAFKIESVYVFLSDACACHGRTRGKEGQRC